nr:AsnC family protein [Kribbella sandramycini]
MLRVRAVPCAAGEVAEALARRPDTSWVNLCAGGTEIECTVYSDDVGPLLLEVLPRTRQVLDVEAFEVLHVFYGGAGFPYAKRGSLRPTQVAELQRHTPEPDADPIALDAIDRRLFAELRRDGRAPIEQLAVACEVSTPTVRRRLRCSTRPVAHWPSTPRSPSWPRPPAHRPCSPRSAATPQRPSTAT